jgi:hypothetical protein
MRLLPYSKKNKVTEISLDHDLGDDDRGTGYDVLLWLEEAVFTQGFIPPTIYVHTANTSAQHKMVLAIANINSFLNTKK